jgi:hypothetical protein
VWPPGARWRESERVAELASRVRKTRQSVAALSASPSQLFALVLLIILDRIDKSRAWWLWAYTPIPSATIRLSGSYKGPSGPETGHSVLLDSTLVVDMLAQLLSLHNTIDARCAADLHTLASN